MSPASLRSSFAVFVLFEHSVASKLVVMIQLFACVYTT